MSSCAGKVIRQMMLYISRQPAPETCCLVALVGGHSLPVQHRLCHVPKHLVVRTGDTLPDSHGLDASTKSSKATCSMTSFRTGMWNQPILPLPCIALPLLRGGSECRLAQCGS